MERATATTDQYPARILMGWGDIKTQEVEVTPDTMTLYTDGQADARTAILMPLVEYDGPTLAILAPLHDIDLAAAAMRADLEWMVGAGPITRRMINECEQDGIFSKSAAAELRANLKEGGN